MTEQEIGQVRDDLAQLGIEQLRRGVMRQLLKIEELTKERDEWLARHAECCRLMGECMQDRADMGTERDALMSAAKLALEALVKVRGMHYTAVIPAEKAIEALRQAGVQ